jgi:hypothetical protein
MMSNHQDNPTSRREVWLTVALAVARGLPEPRRLYLYDRSVDGWTSGPTVYLELSDHASAARWATWLGCDESKITLPLPGGRVHVTYDGVRDGWFWTVESIEATPVVPAPTALAAQVVVAILTPDAES